MPRMERTPAQGERVAKDARDARGPRRCLRVAVLMLAAVPMLVAGCAGNAPDLAGDQRITGGTHAKLTAAQQRIYDDWRAAQRAHDRQADAYWSQVERKKDQRRAKRRSGQSFALADFVLEQPPKYTGPELPAEIARIVDDKPASAPPSTLPSLADFLKNAKTHYGFVPERVSEAEFKRRYAREAVRLGLTKSQVVRVYALETGGIGTADMQAGIHPIKKTGRPISSAIGYAQLLSANTINELVKHGTMFRQRLDDMARAPGVTATRAASLRQKSGQLRRMQAVAKSVPNAWSAHQSLSRTAKGQGIHAINLDGDIGPWLQVAKLEALRELAAKNGRPQLRPNEIELMNLAGPRTGLEMMEPVAARVPTSNFFARRGYERNTIVRHRTASELLQALDQRMDDNAKNAGAIEFARIFDALGTTQQARN
jgi:hypothetical protein